MAVSLPPRILIGLALPLRLLAPRTWRDLVVAWRTGSLAVHFGHVSDGWVLDRQREARVRVPLWSYPAPYLLADAGEPLPGWRARAEALPVVEGRYDERAVTGEALGLDLDDPDRWTCVEDLRWIHTGERRGGTPVELLRELDVRIIGGRLW